MKIIRKIINKIIKFLTIIKIIFQSYFYKHKFYLVGTPVHGNIGDQAILIAEEKFLKDNFSQYKVIEIETNIVNKYISLLRKLIKENNLIFVHGGGFLGSLWLNEEEMFRKILNNFPQNNIIVFPQTVYFENTKNGNKILKDSLKIYSSHKHLTICLREKYSYEFMKKEFPLVNITLIPDMVLYLKRVDINNKRQDILYCIRKDKEKVKYNLEVLNKIIQENNFKIFYTVINRNIYSFNKKRILNNKINEFNKYKLIVTDRLHGMIFSYLAKVPCLVLENKSYKIKGVYDFIKSDYIKLTNEFNLLKDFKEFINKEYSFKELDFSSEYEKLTKIIKNIGCD